MVEYQWLEPHGLPSPKAHLCLYGYSILKNALAENRHASITPIFVFAENLLRMSNSGNAKICSKI